MILKLVNSRHYIDYHTIYLQVETTNESSTMTSEALICNNNISTPVEVDDSDEVEVVEVKQLSTKVMNFC